MILNIILVIYTILIIFIARSIFYDYLLKEKFTNNEYELPKNIYCYWDKFETNPIIQAHIRTWQRNIPNDWKIHVITPNNIKDYVNDDFLKKYGNNKIDSTRFSDFLRIDLLKNKGGCWMDASIIINDGTFINNIYNNMIQNKKDAFFFEYKEYSIFELQPHLDNWFIMAPKNSKIINDLYYEFDKAFEMGFLLYKFKVLIPSKTILLSTIGYFGSTYLLQHAILQYLIKKGNKYNLLIGNASESMYFLHEKFKWNNDDIINFIMNNNNWNGFYGVKLTSSNRKSIKDENEFIKKLDSL